MRSSGRCTNEKGSRTRRADTLPRPIGSANRPVSDSPGPEGFPCSSPPFANLFDTLVMVMVSAGRVVGVERRRLSAAPALDDAEDGWQDEQRGEGGDKQ